MKLVRLFTNKFRDMFLMCIPGSKNWERTFSEVHVIALFVSLAIFMPGLATAQNCTLNANVDQVICANEVLTLAGSKGGLFQGSGVSTWSQISGPSAIIVSPNSLITTVSGIQSNSTYKFRLSAECQDGSLVYDDVSITVKPVTFASAGPDQGPMCPGNGTLLANVAGANETGSWSIVGNNDAGISINNPNSINTGFTAGADDAGTSTLRWTITNANGCVDYDDMTITNLGAHLIVNAGPDQVLGNCFSLSTTTTLAATFGGNNIAGQTGLWTVISGPNIPTITSPTRRNSTVTNLIQGVYILRWTVTGPCSNGFDEVKIAVPAPVGSATSATITPGNDVYCDGRTSMVFSGTYPLYNNEVVTWTQIAGPPAAIASPNSPTTSISGLDATSNYTFRYTISNPVTGCSSTTTSSIVYATAPSLAITTPSPLIAPCNSNSATISYTQAGTGPVEYSIVSAPAGFPGVPTAYAPLGASPATISDLTLNGTYVIQLRKSAFGSGCSDVFQSITVITSVTPSNSNGGTKQLLGCNITSTALVGNVPTIGTGSWSQVSGPNAAVIASPTNPSTNISGLVNGLYRFRWKISGGPACPTRQNDAQVVVSSVAPTIANAGPDQTVCFNTPVYLAGNAPILNETGTWTVSPSAGVVFSPNANTRNAVVTGLVASTAYTFTWTINNACGPGSSDQVVITTTSTQGPVASAAGNDQCLPAGTNAITLAANDPGAGSGAWTKLSGPAATFTNPALRNTSVTGLTDGTYQFIWTITFGSCAVSRDTVMVTISQPATNAVVGSNQNICGTTATLTANTPTTGTGTWTQEAGAGGVTIVSPLAATSSVTGLTAGTYIFRWTISNNACPATMDSVQINVSDVAPVAPNAGPDKSVCGLSTVTMAANNVAPGTGLWSLVSGPNAPVFADMKSPTTTLSGLEAGVYIFRWTSYGGEFCNPLSDDVKIDVTPAANAGPDQSKCFANSANLIGNDGSVGTWSQVGTTPNVATIISATSYSAIASGLIAGTYTFRYTVAANGSCATPSADDMTVTIFTATSAASAGPDQEHCDVTSFNLSANDPAPYTGTWTKVAGPAGGSFSPNANTPYATYLGATPGVYIFSWTISNASCSSVDEVRITNYATPTVAAAGPDQVQVCGTVATMAGNLPVNGLGNWSLVSKPAGAPDPSVTSPILPNTSITNLVPVSYPGTYVFRWTISNGSCTSFSDDVAITVYQQPTIANAGPDQVLCNVSAVTLAGNQALIGTGNWAKVSGPAAIITSPSSYNTTVTGMTPGVYVFEWTTTNLPCSTSDQVTITIDALPTPATTAGTSTDVCLFSPMNLVGNIPLTGTGSWSQSGGAPVTILNPGSATASVAGAAVGNYSFLYTISNGSCPISTSSVSINVAQVPTMALAGADQSVCNTSTTSFTGNTPDPGQGTGTWTQLSGPAAVISDPNNPTSTVTLSAAGSYRFKWEIATNAACTSSDQVVIVKNSDVAVTAPANVTICNGGVATMSVTASGGTPPYTYQWQQSANGTSGWSNVTGGSGATFNTYTTVALATDMYYRCVVTCACGSEISAASLVTVVPDPAITVQPTASTTICSGQSTSLSVTASGGTPSLTYQWQSNTTGCSGAWTNIASATNSTYTTAALTQTTYYRVLVAAAGNGCNTATSSCSVVYVPRITSQPAAYAICTGGVGTLSVTVDAGSSTLAYQWQESADNSSWNNVSSGTGANSASYTSGVLTSNMYYRCIVTVSSPDCGNLVSNSARITVVPDPTITGQPVSPAVICVGGTTANMVVTATGGTPALIYRWQYFNGTTWNNVANGTPTGASYAGWNSATFRVGGISLVGSFQYRCQISATGNDCNTTYTDPVTVTTIPDPVLTTPVFTVPTMCAGGTTVVSSTISGGTGVPTFQWQYLNGASWVNVSNGTPTGTIYTNATTPTMTISGASGAGVKQYRLYTNNSSGCDFYSPAASYTVVADPNITAQPANAAVCVGGINTLSVGAAGGTPVLDYQWRTSSDNITFTDIPGETSSTYTTPVLNTTTYYKVYISATGEGCGNVTSNTATVTVVPDPYIITQPVNAVICTGGNNTLSVSAAGGTPFLIYQWQSSTTGGAPWTNVGASSSTYTTPALLTSTYYRVVISATGNDCNTVTSDPALITVVPDPTVSAQPVGTTLCSGGTHTMSVSASGDPLTGALSYQWQSGPNAGSYTNIAGANTSTYTTGPLASTTYFRCVITQAPSGCSTYSADAVVTVVADPNFTTSPSGLTICTGGAHSMSVVALGGTPSLNYQWQLSADNTSFTDIPGATTTSFATGALTSSTYYRVNISATGVGCTNATSATAKVTVVPDPAINTQPVNAVVCNGGTNTLTVAATGGTPSLNYQWQSSPTGGAPWTNVGSNSNNYTTPSLSATTYYQVVVSATGNDCNTVVSDVATVTVVPDPIISVQPVGATICTGGNHSMSLTAGGDPLAGVLLYQWQSGPNTGSYTNITGANSSSYTSGALASSTYFRCVITQAASGCSVTSSDVLVSVVADPSVTTQPTSPAAICVGGSTSNITIAATGGTPSLVYQWEYNNGGTWGSVANGLPAGAVYTGANATTFAVAGISSAGSYQFRCFVSAAGNGCGTATSNTVTVTVAADPAITIQPVSPAAICAGGTTSNITLTATGGTPSLNYQWQYFNGATWNNVSNGTPAGAVYSGATATTFAVAGITVAGNYQYQCRVTASGNDCNTITSNPVTVSVIADPVLTMPAFSNTSVCAGGSTIVSSTISGGTGTPTYQWQYYNGTTFVNVANGTPAGATYTNSSTPAMTISGTTAAGSYQYRLVTTNGSNCDFISSGASYTVVADPAITTQPVSPATICVGGTTADMTVAANGGTPALVYQWEYNNAGTWSSVSNGIPSGANYSGSNGSTFAVSGIATPGSYQYRCFISASGSGCGTATSNTVTINVAADPAITTQPVSPAAICVGGTTANMTLAASGGTPALGYQWQYFNGTTWNNVANGTPAGSVYTGAVTTTFSIAGINATGNYSYRCLVTATGNDCNTATSNTVTVTVNSPAVFSQCPSDITQNTDPNHCSAVVNYTATATGVPAPLITYTLSGATTASGSGTGSGTAFNKGVTNVVITAANSCSTVTCSFRVTVTDAEFPVITTCPPTRNLEGCSTAAINGPVYSAVSAASTQAEFENATNQGVASDNCGITSVTYSDAVSGSCPITVTRTWVLIDAAGNKATCSQDIKIADNAAPVVICKNITVALNAAGNASITAADINNGSTDNCGIASVVASKTSFTCSDIGPNTVTLTVTDNCGHVSACDAVVTVTDPNAPTLTINDVAVNESAGTATFKVLLSNTRGCDVAFTVNTSDNSTMAGSDYSAVSSAVYTIPAGSLFVNITIPVLNDLIAEPTETYNVNLSSAVYATISDATGLGTILDDDAVSLSLSGFTVTETNAVQTQNFVVTLNTAAEKDIIITFNTSNGTALSGSDYIAQSGVSYTIPAGATTINIPVGVQGDLLSEPAENFSGTIVISNANGQDVSVATGNAVSTINDDDVASLAINDVAVNENAGTATFTVTLTGGIQDNVTVNYATANGTALQPGDYTAVSGTLTFAAGSAGGTTKTITVPVINDLIGEPTENFTVLLSGVTSTSGVALSDATGLGTITDNDAVTMALSGFSVTETNATQTQNFVVTLSNAAQNNIVVNFSTANASALSGSDYTAQNAVSYTIPAGATTLNIPLSVLGDLLDEPTETFSGSIVLANANGQDVSITTASATASILDNDAASIAINDVTVNESAGNATFTVTLTGAIQDALTVNYATANGTAVQPADYNTASGSVTFAAGSASGSVKTIIVPIINDLVGEPTENFTVTLSGLVSTGNTTLSDASGLGTITDDEALTLALSGFMVAETNGSQTANFVATLNTPAEKDIVIIFSTANGTAVGGSDFTAQTAVSYTIPAGSTTLNIPVNILGDLVTEPTENFTGNISISNANGQNISVSTATATSAITDNDAASVAINDITVNESAGTATFTITLTGNIQGSLSVDYTTANGTAVQPGDYTAAAGTITFAAGSVNGSTKTITVPIINDLVGEPTENFTVALGGLVSTGNTTLSDASGLGTITDDDAIALSLSGFAITETNGSQTGNFVITLSNASQNDIILNFATTNITALAASDFTGQASQSYTIPAGTTSYNIPVEVLGDMLAEPTETFSGSITLINANGQDVSITTASATATILDNDAASIAINDVTVNESAGNATFTVTLTGAIQDALTVNYTTANGTAVQPADYTSASGSVTFAAGSASGSVKTIIVPIINDLVGEPAENFTVTLSGLVSTGNNTISDASGVGTITDDDAVTLALSGFNVTETNGIQVQNFVVALNTAAEKDITITFSTANGNAVAGNDFTQQSAVSYTIPAGATSYNIPVTVLGDLIAEPAETFTGSIVISNANGQNVSITTPSATAAISDNDAVSIAINDVTVNENAGTAVFTVTLTGAVQDALTVNYSTANGTAAQPGDYTAASGMLTFNAGSANGTTKTISIPIINDLVGEPAENYSVILSNLLNSGNATVSKAIGNGVINDDDAVVLTLSGFTVTETNGSQTQNFVVTLGAAAEKDIEITFSTANLTATASSDFTGQSSAAYTIPAGSTSFTIPVEVLGDQVSEPSENFKGIIAIANANGQNVSIATASATSVILDNDAVSIAINDVSVNESAGMATFTVTLAGNLQDALTVDYASLNGTAVQPSDYTTAVGTLTFAAGSLNGATKTISVPVISDLIGEPNENFSVVLSNIVSSGVASISDNSGLGTILDDDAVTISLGGFVVTEINGTQVQNYVVTLSTPAEKDIVISFSTANGSAMAGTDYTAQSAVNYTIPAGTTSFNIPVEILGDLVSEPTESFSASISLVNTNGVNAGIGNASSISTILDSGSVSVAINDVTINESAGTANFTVTLTGTIQDALTVNFATANGTALDPADYSGISGMLTFEAGSVSGTTKTITVPIVNDLVGEPTETFTVNLTDLVSTASATLADASGVATILDNDALTLSVSGFSVTETGNTQSKDFVVTLNSPAQNDIIISFITANATAVSDKDYTAPASVSYTIPAGSTHFNIPVDILGDQFAEPTETFTGTIAVTNPNGQNVSIVNATATAEITDDDAASIAIHDVTVNENAGTATFTLTLTGSIQDVLNISYATANGTALQPGDYIAGSGMVTFPAASVSGAIQSITVPIVNDAIAEPTETFTVNLSNLAGTGDVTLSDNSGLGTIIDDESLSLSLNGFTVTEINGTQTQNCIVSLNAPVEKDFVISFTTADGSAIAGSDYTAQNAVSYTIPAGTTSFDIPVGILGDLVSEPDESFTGTITISDAAGLAMSISSATATATIIDNEIIAVDDEGITINGYTGGVAISNVLLNDLLYGTQPTTADVIMTQISSLDPNGNPTMKIRLNANGSVTVDPGTAAGIYHLTYMICEAIHPSNCTQAVVSIHVTAAVIDATADAGSANGMTGGQAVSNVLDNDQLNGAAIHPAEVTITVITPAADPHVVLNPATGEVTVAPGTPSGTYTITYQVCEILNPANCDQATVTISVTAAPLVAANDAGSVSGINGGTAVADVLVNDLLNGNAIHPADVIISLVSSTNTGVSLSGNSVVVAPGTPAGVYYLVYRVCEVLNMTNCSEATATITVTNDAPVANGTSVITTEDKPVTVCIPVTDADAGSVFTATICGNPAHGSLGVPVVTGNQVCITYTPDPNYNGADNFCIQVCDNGKPALCDTASITINVTPVNDAPAVTGITLTTTEDNLVTVCLPITDPDAGSVFTASVCGNPAHGTLSNPEVTGDQVCFTYTPNTNYHGIDQVCIQVCDNGSPILCDTALINIDVISVNDAPLTFNEHETTCNTSSVSGNLLANGDNDPDGSTLTTTLVQLSGPAHGTFSIQANGDYAYTPESTYFGPDQVVISVCDNAVPQPVRCTNDTLFINVVPSVLLTAGPDTAICEKAASFRLAGAAAQHFTSVHWTSSGQGTFDDATLVNPTYTPATADIASGSVVLTISGAGISPCGEATDALTLTFAPAPKANAGNDETFCNSASFKVQHASAANYTSLLWEFAPAYAGTMTDAATLSPTFTPAADFTGDVTLTLKATGNLVCGTEVAQDQMTLTIVTGISLSAGANQVIPTGTATTLHGTASGGSGAYAWSWESSASLVNPVVASPQTIALTKQTSFVLTVLDMISGCSAQDQTVVSIALTAVNDTDTTGVNTPSVIPVLANDAVSGRESIAVSICGNPTYGSVTVNGDNTITYTPTDKYIGDDKFCYMICDNGDPAVCDTATVFIRVKARVDNLLIFNLITPNNDNSNDGWIIRGIEDYPDNTVVIFNRWGDKVKELTGYDNKDVVWDGTNTKGEVLPSGTYYYILTIDNVGSRTGWIYLQGKEK